MNIPIRITKQIETECQKLNHKQLMEDAQTLSEKYRFKTDKNERILTKEKEAWAYAVARMPATFGAIFSALEHTLELITQYPKTVLDIGAGTGTATLVCDELLSLTAATCLERETAMRTVGIKLTNFLNNSIIPNWKEFDIIKDNIEEQTELVIAGYVLNEIPKEQKFKVLDKLWNATTHILLIVDPGTKQDFENLKEIRTYMIKQGANLIAPCPHIQECPITGEDWCHFSSRVSRSKLHKQSKSGEAPFEDEKFTYLAFSKKTEPRAEIRILRHPIIQPKIIFFNTCTTNGLKKILYTKKEGGIYKESKKKSIGDKLDIKQ